MCCQTATMYSLNLIAYLIYGIITFYITVRVGWICYRNGIHFIEAELQNQDLSDSVNKMLLMGYYLMNLGYAALMIYTWQDLHNTAALIHSISSRCAYIVLSLGLMHYVNILVIYLLRRKNKKSFPHS